MKFKSFLAVVACSVVAVSIGISLIVETVKEGDLQSESTSIQNQDSRNKQSTPSMVGSWKSGVNDNEHRYTDPQEIYFDMALDRSAIFAFLREGQADSFERQNFRYTPTKDASVTVQESINSDGEVSSVCGIKWISNNEFIVLIVKDLENPYRQGLKRRFIRIDEPMATILQQEAEQAAARTQRPTTADYTDYNRTVNLGN